jgi:hypothetical protein
MNRIERDRNAVAAVIGTIMALMVILAFISIITLYWIPAAMEENEDNHMKDVSNQFSEFKETLDDSIRTDFRNISVYSTFKLGSEGMPPLADPTSGRLTHEQYDEEFAVEFQDSGENIHENASGHLELAVDNRYFTPQTYIYEQGAILLHQPNGAIMKTGPQLKVTKEQGANNELKIELTLISLHSSSSKSVQGTGSETVKTTLWYTEFWSYKNITSPNKMISLTITSRYSDTVWKGYLKETLSSQGLKDGTDYSLTSSAPSTLELTFYNVSELKLKHSYFAMSIGMENA